MNNKSEKKSRWEQGQGTFAGKNIEVHRKPNGDSRVRLVNPLTQVAETVFHFFADGRPTRITNPPRIRPVRHV